MLSMKAFQYLPLIPLRMILQQMDLLEILDLAMSSVNIRTAAKSLRLPISELKWMIPSPGHFVIHLISSDPDEPKIIIKLAQTSSTKFVPVHLNGKKAKMARSKRVFTIQCEVEVPDKINLFNNLSHSILETFKVNKFHFKSNLNTDFVFNHTRKFESFILDCEKLSLEQVKFVLEDIEVDVFKLEYPRIEGNPQKFTLKHREMSLGTASWLSADSLFDMKCEKIEIALGKNIPTTFICKDFVHFMSIWMNGGFGNLKEFRARLAMKENDETSKMRFELGRELFKLGFVEDLRFRYDIIGTRSDGKRAHVFITGTGASGPFFELVLRD